jgi:hypothetical protein
MEAGKNLERSIIRMRESISRLYHMREFGEGTSRTAPASHVPSNGQWARLGDGIARVGTRQQGEIGARHTEACASAPAHSAGRT